MEIETWGRVFNIFKDTNCRKKKKKVNNRNRKRANIQYRDQLGFLQLTWCDEPSEVRQLSRTPVKLAWNKSQQLHIINWMQS